jgi:uncharacterized protein YqjF (DUF2071 family)
MNLNLSDMNILKKLPVTYIGDLHDVRLINFSVSPDELRGLVPPELNIRLFDGRAIISMVDVQLKKMHPSFLPAALGFEYRHIAFRLLIDDSKFTGDGCHGIYFLRSFTDSPHVVAGGALFTDYNLEHASISAYDNMLEFRKGDQFLEYKISGKVPTAPAKDLHEVLSKIDRAYSVHDGEVRQVRIMRERWPLQQVDCGWFSTSFFKTARFEAAFRVNEVIHYNWLPSQSINLKTTLQ